MTYLLIIPILVISIIILYSCVAISSGCSREEEQAYENDKLQSNKKE